jgi:hypothetical protein
MLVLMRENKLRYQIQVRTADGEGWENRPSGMSLLANDLWSLHQRVWGMIRNGRATYETVRIWDNEEKQVSEVPTSCPVDPVRRLEINKRTAERKAQEEIRYAQERAEAEVRLEAYRVKQEAARQTLRTTTIQTVDQFNQLNRLQRDLLVDDVASAYADTNIDGYGDEGAGYDVEKFTQKLLAMGWTYNPQGVR